PLPFIPGRPFALYNLYFPEDNGLTKDYQREYSQQIKSRAGLEDTRFTTKRDPVVGFNFT
ncbi:hypothetical protein J6590_100547, partial [Homalodisca vitripennis]